MNDDDLSKDKYEFVFSFHKDFETFDQFPNHIHFPNQYHLNYYLTNEFC